MRYNMIYRGLSQVEQEQVIMVTSKPSGTEAINDASERLQTIIDTIPGLISYIGKDFRYHLVNETYEAWLGMPRSQIVGHEVREVVGPEIYAVIESHLTRAMEGEPTVFEQWLPLPTGGRWLHCVYTPHRADDGQVDGVVGTLHDITPWKRAEQAVRESEARKSAILQAALDCIITIDHQGKFMEVNPVTERVFGYTREELLGNEMAELIIPPRYREMHRRGLAHYLATGEGPLIGKRVEITALRSDGTEFPVELAITALRRNGLPMFTGHLRDITEQKQAERKLLRQKARLELLAEAAAGLLQSEKPMTIIKGLFPKLAEQFELDTFFAFEVGSGQEALHLMEFAGVAPAVAETVKSLRFGQAPCGIVAELRERVVMSEVQSSQRADVQSVRALGLEAYACHPLQLEDRLLGTLSFGSWHKKAFEPDELEFFQTLCYYLALALDRARLMKEVAQRAIQLEAAQRQLQEHAMLLEDRVQERTNSLQASLRSMQELLYTIAHNLRAPNRAIQGFAMLELEEYGSKLDDHGRDLLQKISNAAVRNDQLIQDLLAYGRLSHTTLKLEKVSLELVTHKALLTLMSEIQSRQASIRLPEQWFEVLGDKNALEQVITQLLSNAIKFVPSNKRPEVVLSIKAQDARVQFSVADNGIGIAREYQEQVFEPFMRLSTDEDSTGTGIGLAIVHKAVERLGGRVWVNSEPGAGSCFIVELSLAS